jgi:hypothetical protein
LLFSLLQPAIFVALTEENASIKADHNNSANSQINGSSALNSSRSKSRLVEQILGYVVNSTEYMDR